jgi:PAS domain S-box-containing protein
MHTDRNLLFGVLALQADLIDSHQFVEACTLWTSRKNVPLADLLIERGWIEPTDRLHVDYLLERKLKKHGGSARATLAWVPNDVKRSLAALEDADIQQSLTDLPPSDGSDSDATVDYVLDLRERYTLAHLHATGGIGRVWVARDIQLGRDVALKELRPEHAGSTEQWARFLREAQITGQLEHPGVIPVYELSRRPEDHQPFYTMRLIKGRTLTEAVRSYYEKREPGQAHSVEWFPLLNAFVTVCNTVAFAHSRGVIHRDLKGQNVVLGDFGEVIVLDWGLAKLVERAEDESNAAPVIFDVPGSGTADLTTHGQTMGTPSYMAPEQAAGRVDLIDIATDVYGLGAILYEILTGRPPFHGPNTQEVLRQVREEEPLQPRLLCPGVPPALEDACLRALAKRPQDRFDSASTLGQKVQGWQEVERRQAEEALRQSEALYHSLVESIPQNIYRKDLEGRFTFGNQRMCATLGLSPEALNGKTDFAIFPPELAQKYRRDDQRVVETSRTFETVEEHVTPKGEKRFVHVVKTPIHDSLGRIVGTQGIWWDITEKRLAEEELRKTRQRYELVVLGSQDGLWDWNVESGELYFSPRYQSMLGYQDHEMPSRIEDWFERIHPEDRERAHEALHAYFEGRASIYESEFRVRHRDGSYRWVLSRGAALRDDEGRPYRVAGSHEDINARKRAEEGLRDSEERYRAVIGAMKEGIILLDSAGEILACNASVERILELSADQIIGRSARDPRWLALHEDGTPFPADEFPAIVTLRTGNPCRDVVMGVHKPDDTLAWISIDSQPLFRQKESTPYAVMASFSDITGRKRLEQELGEVRAERDRLRSDLDSCRTDEHRGGRSGMA